MFDEKTLQERSITSAPATNPTAAGDPVAAMWAERNRLDAAAEEADRMHDNERCDELDDKRYALEERIQCTRATSMAGVLAQIDLLRIPIGIMGDDEIAGDLRAACETIRAGIQGLPVPAATDLEILSKFRAWCDARRRAWPLKGDENEQALDVADQREEALFAIPSTSAAGLAAKLYMWFLHNDLGGWTDDPCGCAPVESLDPAGSPNDSRLLSIVRDLVCFLPELAPLYGKVVESFTPELCGVQ